MLLILLICGVHRLIFYDGSGKSGASAQGFDHGQFKSICVSCRGDIERLKQPLKFCAKRTMSSSSVHAQKVARIVSVGVDAHPELKQRRC